MEPRAAKLKAARKISQSTVRRKLSFTDCPKKSTSKRRSSAADISNLRDSESDSDNESRHPELPGPSLKILTFSDLLSEPAFEKLQSERDSFTEFDLNNLSINLDLDNPDQQAMADFDINRFRKLILQQVFKFTGKRTELTRFLDSVEDLFSTIPAANAAEIPALLKFVIRHFAPTHIFEKLEDKTFTSIANFKTLFREAVISFVNLGQVQNQLDMVKQGPTEPIASYGNRIKRLEADLRIAYSNANVQEDTIDNLVTVSLRNAFVKNMKPQMNSVCLATCDNQNTIAECVAVLEKKEILASDSPNDVLDNNFANMRINAQTNSAPNWRNRNFNQVNPRYLSRGNQNRRYNQYNSPRQIFNNNSRPSNQSYGNNDRYQTAPLYRNNSRNQFSNRNYARSQPNSSWRNNSAPADNHS